MDNYLDYLAAREQLIARSFWLGQQNYFDMLNRLNTNVQSNFTGVDTPAKPITPPPSTGSRLAGVIDPSQVTPPKTNVRKFNKEAFYDELTGEVIGQKQALEALTNLISVHVRKPKPKRPATVLLAGPTGTGKTLTAEQVAKLLTKHTGNDWGYIRVDLNQLTKSHNVSMLLGTTAGYVGYDDPLLFEPLMKNKRQVILLDEMEKGHPDVLKVLMNAMGNGRLETNRPIDGQREFDFRQSIMLFTSNLPLSVENLGDMTQADITRECREQLIEPADGRPAMPPEIAARFSEILLFRQLSDTDRVGILALTVIRTAEQYELNVRKIYPELLQDIVNHISVDRGARDAACAIESILGEPLAAFASGHEGIRDVALSGSSEQVIVQPHVG